jgi:outer membrane protein insertion porin family
VSVLWVSPFGPIKVSAAQPFRSQFGDKKQVFQFTFGSQF